LETPQAWDQWARGDATILADGLPAASFVEPMLRRRLGRVSRMALQVAHECRRGSEVARTVFTSRHGELQRTVRMLHELSRNNTPSPTDFSLSVHNAAGGIYSIIYRDHAPSISIAAGEESFAYGMLEAAAQWQLDRDRAVLMVYADDPVPLEYRSFVRASEYPHAIALLISKHAKSGTRLRRFVSTTDRSPDMQSLNFLRAWLMHAGSGAWSGENGSWEWNRTVYVG
jgi:hypothetical protein